MPPNFKNLAKRLLIVPPIVAGVALFAIQMADRQAPEQAVPRKLSVRSG